MKGLYLTSVDFYLNPNMGGVYKKIKGQINAFSNLGCKIDFIHPNNNKININGKDYECNLSKIDSLTKKNNVFYNSILALNKIDLKEYDFVYVRFTKACYGMYKFVKKLSEFNVKVIMEIPTYPYKDEIDKDLKNILLNNIDDLIWIKMKKYIYRLVLTNDLKKLYGIKAINIFNAIDINEIKTGTLKKENKEINFIGVANISKWHGYDRLIKGIADYYKNKENEENVNFYIVGDGPEKEKLVNLTQKLKITDNIKFLGPKFGEELEEVYSNMSIGVSSLALFRAGGGHDPIKSKEYVAMGLPVLLGYNDRAFNNTLPFIFECDASNENIDINCLVRKYKSMNVSSKEIKKFAYDELSWDSQMKKVLNEV